MEITGKCVVVEKILKAIMVNENTNTFSGLSFKYECINMLGQR